MQSESGKRTTVMIACTTNETVRVSDPAVYYETDVLHLIYHRGTDARAALYDSLVDERIVDCHIKNLRHKMGGDYIETVRGKGYRIDRAKI